MGLSLESGHYFIPIVLNVIYCCQRALMFNSAVENGQLKQSQSDRTKEPTEPMPNCRGREKKREHWKGKHMAREVEGVNL